MFPAALVESWTINDGQTERRAFDMTCGGLGGGRSGAVGWRWKSCDDSPWQGSPFVSVPLTGALRYELRVAANGP